MNRTKTLTHSAEHTVIAHALASILEELNLDQNDLAKVLGVNKSTVSRLLDDEVPTKPNANVDEKAKLFLRIYRSLSILVGGNPQHIRAWLMSSNTDIGAVPLDIMSTAAGIVHVANYLDAMRGKV